MFECQHKYYIFGILLVSLAFSLSLSCCAFCLHSFANLSLSPSVPVKRAVFYLLERYFPTVSCIGLLASVTSMA